MRLYAELSGTYIKIISMKLRGNAAALRDLDANVIFIQGYHFMMFDRRD